MVNEISASIRRIFTILTLVALAFTAYWFFEIGAMDFSHVNWRFEWSKAQGLLVASSIVGLIFSVIAFRQRRRFDPGLRALLWTSIILLFFTPAIIAAPFTQPGIAIVPGCFALLAVMLMPFGWPFLIPNLFYSIILYQLLRLAFQPKAVRRRLSKGTTEV